MRKLILTDTPANIIAHLRIEEPGIDAVMARVKGRVRAYTKQVYDYQAALLYWLMRQYDRPGAAILEIGTGLGFTAAMMAEAAPHAQIITLNTDMDQVAIARKSLQGYHVQVFCMASWDYLEEGQTFDAIFVDGDHKRIARDLPWWDRVLPGGLMCFHDYTPIGAPRPCVAVYDALNAWAASMNRPLDVIVFDNQSTGFAGMYKHEGHE